MSAASCWNSAGYEAPSASGESWFEPRRGNSKRNAAFRGIHALKPTLYGHVPWIWQDLTWLTGWVALSGRVVEHQLGYRAERAVIRKLRLAVGVHLVEHRIPALERLSRELSDRYQAPVKLGWTERRVPQWLLRNGVRPNPDQIPWCPLADGWRLG